MKLYLIEPVIPPGARPAEVEARLRACIEPIADLILAHLSPDPALFGLHHREEGSASLVPTTERFGDVHVVSLADRERLRAVLVACGDPWSGKWMTIRSLVTCRAVLHGHDGQAMVCLPHDAPPIVSPDPALITVSEQSRMLVETDCMDGLQIDRAGAELG